LELTVELKIWQAPQPPLPAVKNPQPEQDLVGSGADSV
jgi:hypothetical protein